MKQLIKELKKDIAYVYNLSDVDTKIVFKIIDHMEKAIANGEEAIKLLMEVKKQLN